MWIGKIEELNGCNLLTEEVKSCIVDFIKKNDMRMLENGRYDFGNGHYANVFEYDTKDNDGIFEAHKAYIDIHYTISGEEKILYADCYQQEIRPYQEDGDYSLGKVLQAKEVIGQENCCVFLPNEPHKAGVKLGAENRVKKVVFKIAI